MRVSWITLAAVTSGLSIAACGSSGQPSSSSSKLIKRDAALSFAKCMRTHGVSNFPDPSTSGGGIVIPAGSGANPGSPAFQSAQTACRHLLLGGGPGSGPPSAQARAQLLRVSECMRKHGISGFPDPTTGSPPSPGSGYSAVLGRGGFFLAIPTSVNMQSPAFKQASQACNFGPKGGARTAG